MQREIEPGTVIGKWTVLGRHVKADGERRVGFYECRCACGTVALVTASRLIGGRSLQCRPCGYKFQVPRVGLQGGRSKRSEYFCWWQMNHRCYSPDNASFSNYGGRGIQVCPAWRKDRPDGFEAFVAHIGPRPSRSHSIDRYPNNDGDYEPGNVRWATARAQANNMRTNVLLTMDGVTMSVAAWARHLGVEHAMIRARLKAGMAPKDALELVPDKGNNKRGRGLQITALGKTQGIIEWADEMYLSESCVRRRLKLGWSHERAVTTPT